MKITLKAAAWVVALSSLQLAVASPVGSDGCAAVITETVTTTSTTQILIAASSTVTTKIFKSGQPPAPSIEPRLEAWDNYTSLSTAYVPSSTSPGYAPSPSTVASVSVVTSSSYGYVPSPTTPTTSASPLTSTASECVPFASTSTSASTVASSTSCASTSTATSYYKIVETSYVTQEPVTTAVTVYPCATPLPTMIPTIPYGKWSDSLGNPGTTNGNQLFGSSTPQGASAVACCNTCWFDITYCLQAYWYSYEGCVVNQGTVSNGLIGSGVPLTGQGVSSTCPQGTVEGLVYEPDSGADFRSTGDFAGPCGSSYADL